MIEILEDGPITKSFIVFVKNFFELLRNVLVVSTLKYIQIKTGDVYLGAFVGICNLMLGGLISAYFMKFSFKRSLFANDRKAQIFGFILSLILTIPLGFGLSVWMTYLVKVVSEAQLR